VASSVLSTGRFRVNQGLVCAGRTLVANSSPGPGSHPNSGSPLHQRFVLFSILRFERLVAYGLLQIKQFIRLVGVAIRLNALAQLALDVDRQSGAKGNLRAILSSGESDPRQCACVSASRDLHF
jgi:hypothetical protein